MSVAFFHWYAKPSQRHGRGQMGRLADAYLAGLASLGLIWPPLWGHPVADPAHVGSVPFTKLETDVGASPTCDARSASRTRCKVLSTNGGGL